MKEIRVHINETDGKAEITYQVRDSRSESEKELKATEKVIKALEELKNTPNPTHRIKLFRRFRRESNARRKPQSPDSS